MALPPIRPSDSAAIVPQPGDPACTVLTNMVQGLTQWNQFVSWLINEDGSISQDMIDAIGVGGSNALNAPTGVSASEDRPNDVTVTWNGVSDATHYVVFRGTTDDTDRMEPISDEVTTASYVDLGADTDVTLWYSVRAYSAGKISLLSTPDRGIRRTAAADPIRVTYKAGDQDFTVPGGVTTLDLLLWGAGGVGGWGQGAAWMGVGSGDGVLDAGGGGAAGSFLRVTGVAVTPGDKLYVRIGRKWTPGVDGSTYVWLGSVGAAEFAVATAGEDGSNGNYATAGAGGTVRSPGDWGENNLGSGSVVTSGGETSAIGAAGSPGAAIVGGAGATGITRDGFTAGGGGTGVQLYSSATREITYGIDGYAILRYS